MAPGTHVHWPVSSWQKELTDPRGSHSHAGDETRVIRLPVKYPGGDEDGTFTSAAGGAEAVSGRGAAVAVPAHNVGATLTLTPTGLAQGAE